MNKPSTGHAKPSSLPPTNQSLEERIKQILFECGCDYESLGAKGDEATLEKYTQTILSITRTTIEDLRAEVKNLNPHRFGISDMGDTGAFGQGREAALKTIDGFLTNLLGDKTE